MGLQGTLLLAVGLQLAGDDATPRGSGAEDTFVSVTREDAPASYEGREGDLGVPAPWVSEPAIRIDGTLSDGEWAGAARLGGFTQYEPVEGIPASQDTEVRILVSSTDVYVAVRAYDQEPDGVRATLTPRDGFGRTDDYVRLMLDTFDDQRRAFVFQVNPLGVQGDGLWSEGGGGRGGPIDWNPDFLWESAGVVDSEGYSVELRIPLKSLRFPEDGSQDWGLQVTRRIQRNGFSQSWAPISEDVANQLTQAGKLQGLSGLEPGKMMEFNPVLTSSMLGSFDPTKGKLDRGDPASEFGFNASYGITSNLTFDATYNPDFSQVEADAGQIVVNERFALYFPEKRPFFLEGADVFSMPRRLVYTRSIGNPIGAAKLSGKVGSFSVAYIGAVDDVSGNDANPVVNLLRVKRDVGRSSTLGLVYTDRSIRGGGFNRVVGADARLVLADRYRVELLASASADGSALGDTEWGGLTVARFSRAGRNLNFSGSFEDISPAFRARSGFIRRVGVTETEAGAGYTWRGDAGALIESWGPSVSMRGTWDRERFWSAASPTESELEMDLRASFRGNITGFLSLSRQSYAFSTDEYDGLFRTGPDGAEIVPFRPDQDVFGGLWSARLRGWISRWERARISLGASWSETPIFSSGVPADLGRSLGGNVSLSLYPTGELSFDLGVRHSTIRRARDGSRYSEATIPRIEASYQFSRALFARVIGEYSSQTRGEVRTPDDGTPVLTCGTTCSPRDGYQTNDMGIEGLIGYEPSPGTVVYFGYSRRLTDAAPFEFREVSTQADGLFVKLSYRFRM